MKYIKKVLGEDLRQYTMVVALAALIIIFNIASGGKMVTSSNFQNLISGNAYVLVLALGMLMVIVIGQIDLSVGSVAGFASMVMAITARQFNLPWYVAILIALVIGNSDRSGYRHDSRSMAGIFLIEARHSGIHHNAWRYDDIQRRCYLDIKLNFSSCSLRAEMVWCRLSS